MTNQAEIEFIARENVTKILQNIEKNTQNMRKTVESENTKVGKSSQVLQGIMQGLGISAVFSVGNIASAVKDFAIDSVKAFAQSERAMIQFETQVGSSADDLLNSLRDASNGMIANADLVQSSLRAMALGIDQSQLVPLLEVATARARVMGISATQAFEDISTGIGRQSKLILDNLGFILDLDEAYTGYAESVGKTADQLTDLEKKQAIANEIINDSTGLLIAQKFQLDDTLSSLEKINAGWANFKVAAGDALVGVIEDTKQANNVYGGYLDVLQEPAFEQIKKDATTFEDINRNLDIAISRFQIIGTEGNQNFLNLKSAIDSAGDGLREAQDQLEGFRNALSDIGSQKALEELELDVQVATIREEMAKLVDVMAQQPFRNEEFRNAERAFADLEEQLASLETQQDSLAASRRRLAAEAKLEGAEQFGGVPTTVLDTGEGSSIEGQLLTATTGIDEAKQKIDFFNESLIGSQDLLIQIAEEIGAYDLIVAKANEVTEAQKGITGNYERMNRIVVENLASELEANRQREQSVSAIADQAERAASAFTTINELSASVDNVNI